ncbi:MAG: hypothetical protein U0470_02960 [Anaerolineae bacterium]
MRFLSAGTFGYHCVYHGSMGMTGTVVLPVSGTPATPYATQARPPRSVADAAPKPLPTSPADAGEIARRHRQRHAAGPDGPLRQSSLGAGRRRSRPTWPRPSWSPDRRYVAYTTGTMVGTATATAWGIWCWTRRPASAGS